jgi:protein-S-isoprenylcysteine O-methyltransferase Ste14
MAGTEAGNVKGHMADDRSTRARRNLGAATTQFTRYWLPGGIAVGGVVLIILGHAAYSKSTSAHSLESAAGVALLIVALIVWMINWMYRLSIHSNIEREEEEQARDHFSRTGRWPEDEGPGSHNGAA